MSSKWPGSMGSVSFLETVISWVHVVNLTVTAEELSYLEVCATEMHQSNHTVNIKYSICSINSGRTFLSEYQQPTACRCVELTLMLVVRHVSGAGAVGT